MLTASTQAGVLWLLSMLAACALAASSTFTYRMLVWALALFVTVMVLGSGFLLPWVPSTGEVAAIVGCACGWQVLRPGSPVFAALAASACTALAAIAQMQQGAPVAVSAMLSLVVAGIAMGLAKRGDFAPARMREQALTGLVLAAPVIGALPGVMSGWQSAVTINLAANVRPVERFPDWVWQFVVAMLALGVLRQMWVRR